MKKNSESYEFDIVKMLKLFLKKLWIIIICAVIIGAGMFSYFKFFSTPKYSSSVMVYVNNKMGAISALTSSDLAVSKGLVDTYIVILGSRSTLNLVAEQAGISDSYEELKKMIKATSVNSTEVFQVTVTTDDALKARDIANAIADIIPEVISGIVDGSSVKIVDRAVENNKKVSPNVGGNTLIGVIIGIVLGCVLVVIIDRNDDLVKNEDYLIQNYDIPVLAVIPDLTAEASHSYRYYK